MGLLPKKDSPESANERIPRLGATQRGSLAALDVILAAHPKVFEALRRFLADGDSRLIIIAGNHDSDLIWPKVQLRLARELGVKNPRPTQVRFDSRLSPRRGSRRARPSVRRRQRPHPRTAGRRRRDRRLPPPVELGPGVRRRVLQPARAKVPVRRQPLPRELGADLGHGRGAEPARRAELGAAVHRSPVLGPELRAQRRRAARRHHLGARLAIPRRQDQHFVVAVGGDPDRRPDLGGVRGDPGRPRVQVAARRGDRRGQRRQLARGRPARSRRSISARSASSASCWSTSRPTSPPPRSPPTTPTCRRSCSATRTTRAARSTRSTSRPPGSTSPTPARGCR